MKTFITFSLCICTALFEICGALPTWPDSTDEMEDLMYLVQGYRSKHFANGVTPCNSSPDGTARIAAAEWIRTAFHDMATANIYATPYTTGGTDASIMFETARNENLGTAFASTLTTYTAFYNTRASMSDLIALGVYASTRSCGGPVVPIRPGRVDAAGPGASGVPIPENSAFTFAAQFDRTGFNVPDMIAVTACGHSLGGVHAADFPLIVAPGTVKNNYGFADSTPYTFDNTIAVEYVDNNTTDPMSVGIAAKNGRDSDGRVFQYDNNVTITALTDPGVWETTCARVFQKMIDVVPGEVTLADTPLQPYEIKPMGLQLTLLDGATSVEFTGDIRVRTTLRSDTQINSVQLLYNDRTGVAKGAIPATVLGSSRTAYGFDDTFTFYSFTMDISATTSISSFTVSITRTDGTVESYDNNGSGYPVQDSIMLQTPQSCLAPTVDDNNARELTVVAAVRSTLASPTVDMDLILRAQRPTTELPLNIPVPTLIPVTNSMVKMSTVGPYDIYSVTYNVPYSLTFNESSPVEFSVSAGSGGIVYSDAVKSTLNLPAECGTALTGPSTSSTTSSSSTKSSTSTTKTSTTSISKTTSTSKKTTSTSTKKPTSTSTSTKKTSSSSTKKPSSTSTKKSTTTSKKTSTSTKKPTTTSKKATSTSTKKATTTSKKVTTTSKKATTTSKKKTTSTKKTTSSTKKSSTTSSHKTTSTKKAV